MGAHGLHVEVPEALASWLGQVRVALVLGSGLGGVADAVEDPTEIPFASLPGFPHPPAALAGHAGRLVLGRLQGVACAVFMGRLHTYQGLSALDAAYPARLAAALGAEVIVVTNAAGAVNRSLDAGDLVVIDDHINLRGDNPLRGWPGPEGGTPFVSMRDGYDPALRDLARVVAMEEGIALEGGVYAAVAGPSYETPAEVRALEAAGADVVGMSTVPEAIAARALGLRVLGLSLVTNVAAGARISHEEVLAAGERASADLTRLILAILSRL